MFKDFKTYMNEQSENNSATWEDKLYDTCKDSFYGNDEQVSIFSEIYDETFDELEEMPTKEEIIEKFVEYVKDALEKAVFTEEEEDEIEENESEETENEEL